MSAGIAVDLGVAAAAFVGTNTDNGLVAMAMVAAAPPERARRIALGQLLGFLILVGVAVATAFALFELSTRVVGLLGLVPLALGIKGLVSLRHAEGRGATSRRAVGRGVVAATFVTVAAGGDNLAVYIPLFRVAGVTSLTVTGLVFTALEVALTMAVVRVGGHPRLRSVATRIGAVTTPLLFCLVGVLVLWRAGTLSFLS
jgi:cadmium resistance protein CadD (predicted permease)